MKTYLISFLFLAACAGTSPPAQTSDGGTLYTTVSKSSGNFTIAAHLPTDSSPRLVERYLARGVGEECLRRGFEYFDYTPPINQSVEGFCFKDNKRKAFAIGFSKSALAQNPPQFLVESLIHKPNTRLQLNDQIVKVADIEPKSIGDFKSIAFASGQRSETTVRMTLVRQSKVLSIAEPLIDLTGNAYGPDDLTDLRNNN